MIKVAEHTINTTEELNKLIIENELYFSELIEDANETFEYNGQMSPMPKQLFELLSKHFNEFDSIEELGECLKSFSFFSIGDGEEAPTPEAFQKLVLDNERSKDPKDYVTLPYKIYSHIGECDYDLYFMSNYEKTNKG